MQNIKSVFRLFFFLAFLTAATTACKKDPHHILTQKWKMVNNDLVLDIRADSSYIAIENKGEPQIGTWHLSEDEKTILFRQKNMEPVPMQIDTLREDKLVIDNNGDDMSFTVISEQ